MLLKTKDKFRIVLGIMVSVMVLFGVGAYLSFSAGDGYNVGELGTVGIAAVLALLAIYFIWERKKDVDAGMPFEDEFSKKMMYRASYYAYFASMYTALGVSMFKEMIENALGIDMMVSDAVGIIILVPAIVFFIAIFYFKRKGEV